MRRIVIASAVGGFILAGASLLLTTHSAQGLFGAPFGSYAYNTDVNRDGHVNSTDILIVAKNQGLVVPISTPAPAPTATETAIPTITPLPTSIPGQYDVEVMISGPTVVHAGEPIIYGGIVRNITNLDSTTLGPAGVTFIAPPGSNVYAPQDNNGGAYICGCGGNGTLSFGFFNSTLVAGQIVWAEVILDTSQITATTSITTKIAFATNNGDPHVDGNPANNVDSVTTTVLVP